MELAREAITPETPPASDPEADREILLPDARQAYNTVARFVFALQHHTFIETPHEMRLHTEAMRAFLEDHGKGDVAWDGDFVVLRDASVRIREQDQHQISSVHDETWDTSIQLAEECDLPLDLLVVTHEGASVLVTVKDMIPDSLKVVTREVGAAEASDYNYVVTPDQKD